MIKKIWKVLMLSAVLAITASTVYAEDYYSGGDYSEPDYGYSEPDYGYSEPEPDPCAYGHTWEYSYTTDATCLTDGYKVNRCSYCGATDYVLTEPARGHILGEVYRPQGEFPCGQDQYNLYYCARCGECYEEEYAFTAEHGYYEPVVVKDPSCVEDGYKEKECALCGEVVQETIPATGHSLSSWETVEKPTCSKEGKKTAVCRVCRQEVAESIEKAKHEYGPMKILKEVTDHSEGEVEQKCRNCDYVDRQKVIPDGIIEPGTKKEIGVFILQELLTEEKLLNDKVDGIYGKKSEAAVKEFQAKNKFEETGIAYPQTINQLMKNLVTRIDEKADLNNGISVEVDGKILTFEREGKEYIWEIDKKISKVPQVEEAETEIEPEEVADAEEEVADAEDEDADAKDEDASTDISDTVSKAILKAAAESGKNMEVSSEWECPECKNINNADYKFCPKCGAEKTGRWTCEACGQDNEPDSMFCTECGCYSEFFAS